MNVDKKKRRKKKRGGLNVPSSAFYIFMADLYTFFVLMCSLICCDNFYIRVTNFQDKSRDTTSLHGGNAPIDISQVSAYGG